MVVVVAMAGPEISSCIRRSLVGWVPHVQQHTVIILCHITPCTSFILHSQEHSHQSKVWPVQRHSGGRGGGRPPVKAQHVITECPHSNITTAYTSLSCDTTVLRGSPPPLSVSLDAVSLRLHVFPFSRPGTDCSPAQKILNCPKIVPPRSILLHSLNIQRPIK